MLHYFTRLPKDSELPPEINQRVSSGIMHAAKESFTPFYQYLDTTIKAIKKKEDIKAHWSKIKEDNLIELKIIGSLYEVPKTTKIKILNIEKGIYSIEGDYDKDFDIPLIIWNNTEKIKIQLSEENFISKNNIRLDGIYENITKANWAGDDVSLKPTWLTLTEKDIIHQENDNFSITNISNDIIEVKGVLTNSVISINNKELNFDIIDTSKQPKDTVLISDEINRFIVYSEKIKNKHNYKLQNLLDKNNIQFEKGDSFNLEHTENLNFKTQDKSVVGKTVICDGVKLKICDLRNNDKNQYWIQLKEIGGNEKEDIPGFSPLKYFFDDDISIKDEKGNEYGVAQGNESDFKLILKPKKFDKKGPKFTFPIGKTLQVRANTSQLRKQKYAIQILQDSPVTAHNNLIKLFENKEKVKWKVPIDKYVSNWEILTAENRSGNYEQRDFVEKALSTPDFAILEGPPGSGKTTVILELICQLAKENKRVLLCGSTHVAVDNVLERLNEKDKGGETLLEKHAILPLRIGDENRINEDIKEFQIDNFKEKNAISEKLLLDVANLVCGTTIGILQHPKFKNRKANYGLEPIVPEFDYLIIDESSKTTFQEFLVPGLYAKKWILVGDIMQLSPFADREQIVSNLEMLPLKDKKTLAPSTQQAVFYLLKILEITKDYNSRYILPLPKRVLSDLLKEIEARKVNNNQLLISVFDESSNKLELIASNLILIDQSILNDNMPKLPETHAILRSESWQNSEHAFIHNHWQNKGNTFKVKKGKNSLEGSFKITEETNTYFKEKSWAEEIAWRIDREHQLRLLENSKTNYRKIINDLIPKSLDSNDIENRINTLASIAFPSILESLIEGVKSRKYGTKTTISEGFSERELNSRRTVLKYQHRMHPDISKFPREQFYKKGDALLDLESPNPIAKTREWSYIKYNSHSIWVDVKGKSERNYNIKEVDQLISELKIFIDYASKNKHPNGEQWTVACLAFYTGQETKIREKLRGYTKQENAFSNFNITQNGAKINIKLHTVDKFQGHEADIVFLSMVQTFKDGFMDNPNRLNVAITRAKFQLVILGDYQYFAKKSRSEDLKKLAINTEIQS
ncbi:AAA family ATPase [Tenacibaculum finnmarkense]|uniref:AAA domain-containing protein n=1 Tax=Tenacibaculum finnmarkense TaxID=2781243 RepID=UPI001EFBF75B|nr:AAA domain-containing protein [Tenacibaculum finnmarkense]MCG8858890.1 AAA family ATPase [Tenacibaculum finnmarkense]MCG8882999.1 AAA family ATPase [Tenacibaculum finnmarkense]